MGEVLKAGDRHCHQRMFYIPEGYVDELETLLANEPGGRGRGAAQAFFDGIIEAMRLDESPRFDLPADCVNKWGERSPAQGLPGEEIAGAYMANYQATQPSGVFREAEIELLKKCDLAHRHGKPLPMWRGTRVPESSRAIVVDGYFEHEQWSLRAFGPWARRFWLPYPVEAGYAKELDSPSAEVVRGAEALLGLAKMARKALPWIESARNLYVGAAFPMLACARGLVRDVAEAADSIASGKIVARSARAALLDRLDSPVGYALYCGAEDREGSEAGFVADPDREALRGLRSRMFAWAPAESTLGRRGSPLLGAALFSSADEAEEFAADHAHESYVVVKISLAPMAVERRVGDADDGPLRELCAGRERAELDSACSEDGEASSAREIQIGGRGRKAKARRRL